MQHFSSCSTFYATLFEILLARPASQQPSSAYALRWINYWNITVVMNRSNVLILSYHNIKTPIRFASKRFATRYHMIEIYHVISFEYDSYSNRETDFQETWKSELGIQKRLNSAYWQLESLVGKVKDKIGKFTSISWKVFLKRKLSNFVQNSPTFSLETFQFLDFSNYTFHPDLSPEFSSTQLCAKT